LTPYAQGLNVDVIAAINYDGTSHDVIGAAAFDPTIPENPFDIRPYAIWAKSSVPEPSTLLLSKRPGIGLIDERGQK